MYLFSRLRSRALRRCCWYKLCENILSKDITNLNVFIYGPKCIILEHYDKANSVYFSLTFVSIKISYRSGERERGRKKGSEKKYIINV